MRRRGIDIIKIICKLALIVTNVFCMFTNVTVAKEIKPGAVINQQNYKDYLPALKDLLAPSRYAAYTKGLEKGWITMPVVSDGPRIGPPPGVREATAKYASQCKLLPNGQLTNYVAGNPFPNPKTGLELAWNGFKTRSIPDDAIIPGEFHLINKKGIEERSFKWILYKKFWIGRTHIPPLGEIPGNKGILESKESLIITSPFDVKGFIMFRVRYWDLDRSDDCYSYLPALRRIRRLTGSDVTDPLLGSDATPDDFQVWRQKINPKMTFKNLGVRDYLETRYYPGNKNPLEKDMLRRNCLQVEWEIRPLYTLEVMINDPDYVYSKRVITIEKYNDSYNLINGSNYDQKGRLFKSDSQLTNFSPETGIYGARCHTFRNLITDHTTQLVFVFTIDGTPVADEKFSIKHLLKSAR